MAIVNLVINSREYTLACNDGEEEYLHLLAIEVNKRVQDFSQRLGKSLDEPTGLLLAAIGLADELVEAGEQPKYNAKRLASAIEEVTVRIENLA